MVAYLESQGIHDEREHLMYHHEYWKMRVGFLTPEAEQHARQLELVNNQLKQNEWAKQHLTDEFDDYFEGFIADARCGLFEPVREFAAFDYRGRDANGFKLWHRRQGTVGCECNHQKMQGALGHWSIGTELGHYVLLLVQYRWTVSARVKRQGNHYFGHPFLHLIDRIQLAIQDIYNVVVFPNHQNGLCFKPLPNFTAVGIRPLSLDPRFVDVGPVSDSLTSRDLRFASSRLGLKMMPLPVTTKREIQIFNEFMRRHPKPTMKNWEELAIIYKRRADGLSVFPKLPTMLKQYHQKWKTVQQRKIAGVWLAPTIDDVQARLNDFNQMANKAVSELVEEMCAGDHDTAKDVGDHVVLGWNEGDESSAIGQLDPALADQAMHADDPARGDEEIPVEDQAAPVAPLDGIGVALLESLEDELRELRSDEPLGMPQQYLPPFNAPYKARPEMGSRRCANYPQCDRMTSECGGIHRELCRIFGNGAPEEANRWTAEQLQGRRQQDLDQKKSRSSSENICTWYPYCRSLARDCFGTRKHLCKKFGKNGTHRDIKPDMSSSYAKGERTKWASELKRRRRKRKAEQMAASTSNNQHANT